jgi:hypothetical protein
MKRTASKLKPKHKKHMPPKDEKITDVSRPGKTMPSASGRPLIVTNRPVLADPMVVAAAGASAGDSTDETSTGETPTAPVIKRTARTIVPVNADAPAERPDSKPDGEPEPAAASADTAAKPATTDGEASQPKTTQEPSASRTTVASMQRDSGAEASAEAAREQAEQDARAQELERLIETGAYIVPINAVQRKRSRMFVAVMCILALLLLVALADAALDANLFDTPVTVPHTHFFSGK